MIRLFRPAGLLVCATAIGACSSDYAIAPDPERLPAIVTASGSLAGPVDTFRALLGEPSNGTAAGEQPAGRREISWDGAAANAFNNRNDFPAAFFNTTAKSGAVFTTPGMGFRNDSLAFREVNAGYPSQFVPFSPTKMFSPVGSNVMDVLFQVAGQPTPAQVTGFGAVFSDVDQAGVTTIEFFDVNGASLGIVAAPVRSDEAGLSFAGARFPGPIVARVRITLGAGSLGATTADVSAGGTLDLVVVDNFLYGEPKATR